MKTIKAFLLILICFMVVSSTSQAAITGENLMLADKTNTVRVSDNSVDWFAVSPGSSQWQDRGSGGAFVAAVDPVLGAIDVAYQGSASHHALIRSTITGLSAGMRVRVWVLTSFTANSLRKIDAGYDDGSALTTYSISNATDTGLISHSTDWFLYECNLGVATADANGEVKVLVDYTSGAERSVYHGLAYSPVLEAWNPSPADGTSRLFPEDNPVLSWNPGQDPNNPANPNPKITKYILYMSSNSDPNSAPVFTEVARLDPAVTQWTPSLVRDRVYYWRVDERLQDDSHIIAGPVWEFSTAASYAEIDASYPKDVRISAGQDAVFSVVATNPFTAPAASSGLSYQWYKGDGMDDPDKTILTDGSPYSGTTTDTLTVSSASVSEEGNYFCLVTVDNNGHAKASSTAYLVIKRLVGHWKLDGNAKDELGNDGTPVGDNISYDVGIVGPDPNCLHLDNETEQGGDPPVVSYIEIPNRDSYREDAFTVSCWVKSIKPGFHAAENYYGSVVSKTDSSGTNPGWCMRRQNYQYNARWFTYGSASLVSDKSIYFMAGSDWHQLVGVYDEEHNFKALYIDGVLNKSLNNLGSSTGLLVADGKLCIGADIYSGTARSPGDILIDDVRLYNYALSGFEIAQLYVDVAGGQICVKKPAADFNGDCKVDINDLSALAREWLVSGIVSGD